MIKIDNDNIIFVDQIVSYQKSPMYEATYIKSKTYKEFIRGGFLKALFHWDFSRKDVIIYYEGRVFHLFEIGDWDELVKYCNETVAFSIIDGKIYDMPHITFYLSDGSKRTMFFESDEDMLKMEKQIIETKTNNKNGVYEG